MMTALADAFKGISLPHAPTSEASFEVTIKPMLDGWFVVGVVGSDTICKLKEKIYGQKGYPLDRRQRMFFKRRLLADDLWLATCGFMRIVRCM